MRTISIFVPCLNAEKTLRGCLKSLQAQSYAADSFNITLIDNGSTDSSTEIAKELNIPVLSLPSVSISALRNHGAAQSSADLLVFVDADCELDALWLERAAKLIAGRVAAAGSPMLYSMQSNFIGQAINAQAPVFEGAKPLVWVPSAALMVRADVFKGLGGFDEGLLTCEDVDFGYRLRCAGWRLLGALNLSPRHFGDPDTFVGLAKKEYWRASDTMVLLYKYPWRLKEILTNLYQPWFFITAILAFTWLALGDMLTSLLYVLLFCLPVLFFTLRTACQRKQFSIFKSLLYFYLAYYLGRSLCLPRSLQRLYRYIKRQKSL